MITFLFYLPFLLLFVVLAVYGERKISAFIQDRLGPMEVGYKGILQTVADLMKLLQKEDIVNRSADGLLFRLGPSVIFTMIFAGYAVVPLTSSVGGAGIETGVFFLLAIISLDVIGILLAGWGSNSKFSLFGAMRSAAQIISYEIPLGLSVLCVVMLAQSLDLQEISIQQGIFINDLPGHAGRETHNYLFGIFKNVDITETGGILSWNIMRMPLFVIVLIIFFIAGLSESNRAPFDIPEAESELVGGYHTEYSGFRFAVVMLSEYGMMLLICLLAAILFLGSWNTPFPNIGSLKLAEWTSGVPGTWAGNLWSAFWLLSKASVLILVMMWIRWTYPRLRVDQLMTVSWKYLTPAALIMIFITGIWRIWMV
jgi:NADH-quinone oxidoreductase subunit H